MQHGTGMACKHGADTKTCVVHEPVATIIDVIILRQCFLFVSWRRIKSPYCAYSSCAKSRGALSFGLRNT